MAYVKNLFNTNFMEYASYVIKDRAIPHLVDGLKPVQRRILHSLFEMDDGKFHKVANVVGHCMKYHPHGDASIYSALVVLANKEIMIDRQGNFGNIYTGDEASAARYIECRNLPLAKELLYNPNLTEFTDSYDGRNKEPTIFPAKVPLVLILGAEGIAVGMATKILPHNYREVIGAVKAAILGESFQLYPDFITKGIMDASNYEDGRGSVRVRAKLDTKDPKKIIVREIPYGTTTESLINSIENAAKKGKVKIATINDFTAEDVEIEIKLPRGVHTQDVVDALYAFTDCEVNVSCNLLVIRDNMPVEMTVTEVVQFHAGYLVELLTKELKLEEKQLLDRLHMRTLEQIFIEERIYKSIEDKRTQETIYTAILQGFEPFKSQIRRKITQEDLDRLLKIPIRRISLFDIEKAKKEIREIKGRLKEIKEHLANIKTYAAGYLDGLLEKSKFIPERQTIISSFQKVDVREAAIRDQKLRYDTSKGYLGTKLSDGSMVMEVSPLDRILLIDRSGEYRVIDVPEKEFVGKNLIYIGPTDKEAMAQIVFSILYQNKSTKHLYLKRTKIEKYIIGKNYELLPEDSKLLKFTTKEDWNVFVGYVPKKGLRILEEVFPLQDFLVKGVKAAGVRLTTKEIKTAKFMKSV
jgi:topoisomerase-4 subunit A